MENNPAADDERAIRELVDTWFEATRAGDVQTVLDLMTDDVRFLVPDREPFGKDAFEAASREMEPMRIDGTGEIEERQVLGDRAYLRTEIEVTVTPPDGSAPVRRSGHTLSILRKGSDGRWRIARDADLVTADDRDAALVTDDE